MTDAAKLVPVLLPLVIKEPWSASVEGLDDLCMFCRSWSRTYHADSDTYTYDHLVSCSWLVAMNALGRPHPHHVATGEAQA